MNIRRAIVLERTTLPAGVAMLAARAAPAEERPDP